MNHGALHDMFLFFRLSSSNVLAVLLVVAVVSPVWSGGNPTTHWGYMKGDGLEPNNWKDGFPLCAGKQQSPVKLQNAEYNKEMTSLELIDYDKIIDATEYILTNNGHSLSCSLKHPGVNPVQIVWKGTPYVIDSFHFHWGKYNQQGSEHLVGSCSFPLEMHIIHYKKEYHNITEAIKHKDGLLVWGNFFIIGACNKALQKILDKAPNVMYAGDSKKLKKFPMSAMIPDDSEGTYFHYEGSLTTPHCNEAVMWIINHKNQTVSSKQMDVFRTLFAKNLTMETHHLYDNYRPVQPINDRKIYTSVKQCYGVRRKTEHKQNHHQQRVAVNGRRIYVKRT